MVIHLHEQEENRLGGPYEESASSSRSSFGRKTVFFFPNPPAHLTRHQKRQWREEQWVALHHGQPSQAPTFDSDRGPKARAEAISGNMGWPRTRSTVRSRGQWWTWIRRLRQSWPMLVLAMMMVIGSSNGLLWQAAPELGETSTVVAAHALNLTTTVASSATDLIVSATTNGLSTADNLWRGVDITDVVTDRCMGHLVLDDASVLLRWLNTSEAHVLIPCLDAGLESIFTCSRQHGRSRYAGHSHGVRAFGPQRCVWAYSC